MPLIKVAKCVNCGGKPHEWEFKMPSLRETREVIEVKAGITMREFMDGMETMNGSAFTALMFMLHKRIGVDLRWNEVDLDFEQLDMDDLPDEIAEAEEAGKEAGKEEAEELPES